MEMQAKENKFKVLAGEKEGIEPIIRQTFITTSEIRMKEAGANSDTKNPYVARVYNKETNETTGYAVNFEMVWTSRKDEKTTALPSKLVFENLGDAEVFADKMVGVAKDLDAVNKDANSNERLSFSVKGMRAHGVFQNDEGEWKPAKDEIIVLGDISLTLWDKGNMNYPKETFVVHSMENGQTLPPIIPSVANFYKISKVTPTKDEQGNVEYNVVAYKSYKDVATDADGNPKLNKKGEEEIEWKEEREPTYIKFFGPEEIQKLREKSLLRFVGHSTTIRNKDGDYKKYFYPTRIESPEREKEMRDPTPTSDYVPGKISRQNAEPAPKEYTPGAASRSRGKKPQKEEPLPQEHDLGDDAFDRAF